MSTPPLTFRRSLSLTTRALFASAIAIAAMVADWRLGWLEPLRDGLSIVARPLLAIGQFPAMVREQFERATLDVLVLQRENAELRTRLTHLVVQQQLAQRCAEENDRLRALLGLSPLPKVRLIAAEVLFDTPDPFSRRVVVDRGSNHGVRLGFAVVDLSGLVGQVTRVQPLVSEVTLLVQEGARVPVEVVRTGTRGIAWGVGDGRLQLRDVLGEWRVREGDELITSGLDGLFPRGLPVGRVVRVEGASGAPIVLVEPFAAGERLRQILIAERLDQPGG
ncbi:MAG: rod shape-determining protein MreC [Hydrogenophilus sp.]|nr:rod shape-determining protein MreC [Hydrogenophilus sp.]